MDFVKIRVQSSVLDLSGLGQEPEAGSYENGKEISEPIKSEQFINFIPITDVSKGVLGFFLWRANTDPVMPVSEHHSVVNALVGTNQF
jgi:hypothetical protein